MENKFKQGDTAYLRVRVDDVLETHETYDYVVSHIDHGTGNASTDAVLEEQIHTAEDVASIVNCPGIDWQATYNEYSEKAQRTIAGLSKRITEMNALLEDVQARAKQLESALSAQNDANLELEDKNALLSRKNDELETTVSELSVLVDKLRKEMAQREKGWDNVSRNNDVAVLNLNRLCKQREVLTDRIIALEAELEAEREKNNG